MARENKSKYAILGVLTFRPMSGYDIRKVIESSLANFWSESYGQIYPILRRLVEEGLATRHIEPGDGRPDRHVYSITSKGRQELRGWLAKPIEQDVLRVEVLLKLFFGTQVGPERSLQHVQQFREIHRESLERYRRIEKWLASEHSDSPGFPYWLLTLSYGRHVSSALMNWCDEAEVALAGMEPRHESIDVVETELG